MRGRTPVAVLVAASILAGCGVTRTVVGQASPVTAATITIHPAPGAAITKPETDQAVDVISTRLKSLGIGTFSIAAGNDITVSIGTGIDVFKAQAAIQSNGVVDFSPQPGDEPVPEPGSAVSGQESLWTGDDVEAATATTDAAGAVTIDITLTAAGAAALRTWSTAHVGDNLMIVVDDRVLATPKMVTAIDSGRMELVVPNGGLRLPADVVAAILASGPLPEGWRQP